MDTGTISTRYAAALLAYVTQTGAGERVCKQVRSILDDKDVPAKLEAELERFLQMVEKNGRMEFIRFILTSFVRAYNEANGIVSVKLTTPAKSDAVEQRLKKLIETKGNCTAEIKAEEDPSIIGGFIVEIDDNVLDASVKGQLSALSREMSILNHNRIV